MAATTSSDYTGRTVDLFIMQGAQATGVREITTSLDANNGGKVIAGVQKAAQTFMVIFLTNKGSRQHDPEFGTRFMATICSRNMNASLMPIIFRDAAEDVLDQQERYRATTDADDEVISAIELLTFTVASPTNMSLTVQITTRAGTTRTVILPVSLAVK